MCRYAFTAYKQHFACFACRKAFKSADASRSLERCPNCGGPIFAMGLDFKAPGRSDKSAWQAAQILTENGIDYGSCGCNGPGFRPVKPSEAQTFARQAWLRRNPNAALLEKFKSRSG